MANDEGNLPYIEVTCERVLLLLLLLIRFMCFISAAALAAAEIDFFGDALTRTMLSVVWMVFSNISGFLVNGFLGEPPLDGTGLAFLVAAAVKVLPKATPIVLYELFELFLLWFAARFAL